VPFPKTPRTGGSGRPGFRSLRGKGFELVSNSSPLLGSRKLPSHMQIDYGSPSAYDKWLLNERAALLAKVAELEAKVVTLEAQLADARRELGRSADLVAPGQ